MHFDVWLTRSFQQRREMTMCIEVNTTAVWVLATYERVRRRRFICWRPSILKCYYVYPTATSCARSRVTKDDMTQYGRNIAITIMVKDNQLAEMVS